MVAQQSEIAGRLDAGQLNACFEYEHHLKHIERAYQRLRVDQDCGQILGWPVYDGGPDRTSSDLEDDEIE
jgi:hypothetical protein